MIGRDSAKAHFAKGAPRQHFGATEFAARTISLCWVLIFRRNVDFFLSLSFFFPTH